MKNSQSVKLCDWCGEKISKAWQKNPDHHFCNVKCYHKWRSKNYRAKGQKQDWSHYRKLQMLRKVKI